MSDAVGTLTLPVAAPVVHPPHERTLAPGDPALVQIGSFAATALQADCGAAWEALDPGRPAQPGAVDGTRLGTGVVRRVWYQDPRLGYFEPAELPGLFVFRAPKADYKRFAADQYRRVWPIQIAWLPPRAEADPQRRERDTFANAVAASLDRNIRFGRHRAWVLDSDLAAPTGLLADTVTTSTSVATLTSFDGTLAASALKPGRPLQILTAVAAAAYNTTDPILVTGKLDSRATHTDKLYLTATNGGETLVGLWSFTEVTQIVLPAQLLATGQFTIGFYDSPDVKLGSLVQRAAGVVKLELRGVSMAPLRVQQPNAEPIAHVAVEATVDVIEEIAIDLAEHAEALSDPADAAGLDASFLQGNNDPFNAFSL
jgi:hypothetical protein